MAPIPAETTQVTEVPAESQTLRSTGPAGRTEWQDSSGVGRKGMSASTSRSRPVEQVVSGPVWEPPPLVRLALVRRAWGRPAWGPRVSVARGVSHRDGVPIPRSCADGGAVQFRREQSRVAPSSKWRGPCASRSASAIRLPTCRVRRLLRGEFSSVRAWRGLRKGNAAGMRTAPMAVPAAV